MGIFFIVIFYYEKLLLYVKKWKYLGTVEHSSTKFNANFCGALDSRRCWNGGSVSRVRKSHTDDNTLLKLRVAGKWWVWGAKRGLDTGAGIYAEVKVVVERIVLIA